MIDEVVTDTFHALIVECKQLLTAGLFGFTDEHWMIVTRKRTITDRTECTDCIENEWIRRCKILRDPFLHLVGCIDIHSGGGVANFLWHERRVSERRIEGN